MLTLLGLCVVYVIVVRYDVIITLGLLLTTTFPFNTQHSAIST